jgi:hypothetical protein
MAENPFGTPLAQLALDMALRNQALIQDIPAAAERQRGLINQRLQRYGGDISQYENIMDVGYQPAVNSLVTEATAMRDYLVGLPELLSKAAKEGKTGTGGSTSGASELKAYFDNALKKAEDYMGRFAQPVTRLGTADTAERWANPITPRPATARRVTSQSIRPGGTSFGIKVR